VVPSILNNSGNQSPRIDIVLQATGTHAHAVSHGIVNSLHRLGLLGRVFRPNANWGEPAPLDDDGLFDYLSVPESEFILFLGFDWHSQSLHTSTRWRQRIRMSPIIKVGYLHETVSNGSEDEQRTKMRALISCHSLIDIILHASPAEVDYIGTLINHSRPVLASGFGVDIEFFKCQRSVDKRPGFAFFRGKVKPFTQPSQYQERRELIEYLQVRGLVDVMSYTPSDFSDAQLVDEYNDYKICIDPPSIFAGPTTRVFEALACGCVVFSHARNFSEEDVRKFSPMLRTFSTKEDLVRQLEVMRDDAAAIASKATCLSRIREAISLDVQLRAIYNQWSEMLPNISLCAPILRIFGHPYHTVTQSSNFIFDHFSDLNTVLITCDSDERAHLVYSSPTFQQGCYMELGWQTIHIYPHFNSSVPHKRVLFPMFDGSNHRLSEAFPRTASYVCFSHAIHDRIEKLGLDSTWVRYFPDDVPSRMTIDGSVARTERRQADGGLKAYFWQRTSQITLCSAISICCQLGCTELIVNTHHDPGEVGLDLVSEGVVNGVRIRTHGWLERRSDAYSLIDDCDVYIAPRRCEGIGLSFLEAMSRGLCVVAFDAPTMNEYIEDGINGLLYSDIRNPQLRCNIDIAALRRRVAADSVLMAADWRKQFDDILHQYHPYYYSVPLRWLRERGVTFRKHFDFRIPIDSA